MHTGFSNCIPPVTSTTKMLNTMPRQFIAVFLLSFHLNPTEYTTKIISNAVSVENYLYTEYEYQALPRFFIDEKLAIVPKIWQHNSSEKIYLDSINIINEKSLCWEQGTIVLTEKRMVSFVRKGTLQLTELIEY